MPVRKRKPTSPGRRFQTVSDFAEVTRDRPDRSLVKPKPRTFRYATASMAIKESSPWMSFSPP